VHDASLDGASLYGCAHAVNRWLRDANDSTPRTIRPRERFDPANDSNVNDSNVNNSNVNNSNVNDSNDPNDPNDSNDECEGSNGKDARNLRPRRQEVNELGSWVARWLGSRVRRRQMTPPSVCAPGEPGRGSRFTAWNIGPSGAVLTITRRLGQSVRQPGIVSVTR
jgi:hypothetical protein